MDNSNFKLCTFLLNLSFKENGISFIFVSIVFRLVSNPLNKNNNSVIF